MGMVYNTNRIQVSKILHSDPDPGSESKEITLIHIFCVPSYALKYCVKGLFKKNVLKLHEKSQPFSIC